MYSEDFLAGNMSNIDQLKTDKLVSPILSELCCVCFLLKDLTDISLELEAD